MKLAALIIAALLTASAAIAQTVPTTGGIGPGTPFFFYPQLPLIQVASGSPPVVIACTGGTQTVVGSNVIFTFNASGTLNCTNSFAAQELVVAGGGGASGAGGGAGGLVAGSITIPTGTTEITVGNGGAGAIADGGPGKAGGNSSIGTLVTANGGGPGGLINANAPNGGGSGGGTGPTATGNGPFTGGSGTSGQGNAGGASFASPSPFPGAGGGGAGAAGTPATSSTAPGNGGNGLSNSITGTATPYAGGGGGGFDIQNVDAGGTGGAGGGGAGSGAQGAAGAPNTGGGGGGSGGNLSGGAGGTGVVIISCSITVCGGGTSTGFLKGLQAQFVVNNFAPSSNDFVPADGFWTASNTSSSNPTVTTVSDTLPDGTTGNVSQAAFPAITSGTTQVSVLTFNDTTHALAGTPMSHNVWAKVVSGTGTLFSSVSSGAIFGDAPITNDGQWHLVQATWTGSILGAGGGAADLGISIGINQNFSPERVAVSPITVELAGDYFVQLQSANVPAFADVKTGGPLAVTGTPPLQAQLTEPLPPGVAIRDASQWSSFSGNPIVIGDPSEVWGAGGRGNPVIQAQFQSGGFFWAFSPQCFPNVTSQQVIIAACLFKSTDGLNWTEDTTNAPYLLLTGGILANPTVNSGGSGFTAGTGTATYTGTGCPIPPVIAVTVTGTVITSATPSPNNGVGTGSCSTWPTNTDWAFTGVGAGSGASFTWSSLGGTAAAPAPATFELHPQFLPFGCNDGTTPHNTCIIYSATAANNADHLYVAWTDGAPDSVYTPIGCTSGECPTAVPVTINNLPPSGYGNPGVPTVMNVGGATGVNYIQVYTGDVPLGGVNYSVYTTPANKAITTSGNTLTFLHDAGITIVSGKDWSQPTTGTQLIDPYIFLNHCGFYELYFALFNSSVPSPPWDAGSPGNTQLIAEGVSNSPTGPWYQFTHPVFLGDTEDPFGNGGDPAAIELGGKFILTSPFNDPASRTGAGFALTGPVGTCPTPIVVAPTETALPVITGVPQVGSTLTATNGSWTGAPTIFTYQWLSGGSPISGATSQTFVPTSAQSGDLVSVTVTATSANGSTSATSLAVTMPAAPLASCTGGTHTSDGAGNTVMTFTASGTLNCTGSFPAQTLVVAGGGGATGAGGGAGGYCTTEGTPTCGLGPSITIPSGATTVTLGTGGAGAIPTGTAINGTNSSLGTIVTATGGGAGGANNAPGMAGGSGGGAGPNSSSAMAGGAGSQGNNGGAAFVAASVFPGAGGGGAGAPGAAPTVNTVAGNGGNGLANPISGSSVTYAGGGGAGFAGGGGATFGSGGTGGGGKGATSSPTAGAPNTGGGGGGSQAANSGASGGSGVVIISCPTTLCGS
jgi:glycine rich protein